MVNLEFGRMENLEYPTPMENLEEMTRSASLDGDAGDDVEWGTVLASVHLIKKYLTDLRGNGFGNPELVNGLLNNDSVSGADMCPLIAYGISHSVDDPRLSFADSRYGAIATQTDVSESDTTSEACSCDTSGMKEDHLRSIREREVIFERNLMLMQEKELSASKLQALISTLSRQSEILTAERDSIKALNISLEEELRRKDLLLGASESNNRILNPPKESHNKTDKQWQKGSLEREDYFAKLLESKDVEILRMQTALHNKMHQTKIVEELRKQLELQSRDFEKLVREKEALVPLVKNCNEFAGTSRLSHPLREGRRSMSLSRLSLKAAVFSLEDEPQAPMETVSISSRLSRHDSRTSICSRTDSYSFRYKEDTPARLEELERRNKAQLPHMKSCYPVESTESTWKNALNDESHELSQSIVVDPSLEVPKSESGGKTGFLQKLQTSFTRHRRKNRKSDMAGSKENVLLHEEIHKVLEKPVAFTIKVTPENKKSRKLKKKPQNTDAVIC